MPSSQPAPSTNNNLDNVSPSTPPLTPIKEDNPETEPTSPYTNLSRHTLTNEMVFGPIPNRAYHEGFMRKAIDMAEMALASDETPVGCVFVREGEVIGRGINGTNASLNGTRHAEFVALAEIMSTQPQSILRTTDLYVTVEPCIMCASALRQYGIRSVYFGCLNDRFGGTGGVMTVHMDQGVDPPFPVFGGLFREEAIMLLRRFYVQENDKAPEPKPKKNRELKTEIKTIPMGVLAKEMQANGLTLAHTNSSGTTTTNGTPAVGTPTTEIPAVIDASATLPSNTEPSAIEVATAALTINGASELPTVNGNGTAMPASVG